MASSIGTAFIAVFAVSGSVVFLAVQAHKRLHSKFMKQMEFVIKHSADSHSPGKEIQKKKKMRFAAEVKKFSGAAECTAVSVAAKKGWDKSLEGMPQNWQAMYIGILQSRNPRACY